MSKRDEQEPAPFFHGTSALAAVCISIDGFRLLPVILRRWYLGLLGHGIYITASLRQAAWFSSGYIFRVRLAPGTRILRLDGQCDPRVIDSLRREFGKDVLGPGFDKAIPSNKHLRRVEVIHLLNYHWAHHDVEGKRRDDLLIAELAVFRRYLARCHYAGLGSLNSDAGVVVFNPTRLLAHSLLELADCDVLRWSNAPEAAIRQRLSEADPTRLALVAAAELHSAVQSVPLLRQRVAKPEHEELVDLDRDELRALLAEVPRWQVCLRRFCEKHRIAAKEPVVASALMGATTS
jgi:hypothetical protein